MTYTGKQTNGHRHDTPHFITALPAPAEQIDPAARAHVVYLLAAVAADCEQCVTARLTHLIEKQHTDVPPAAVTREGPIRSMTLGGQSPGVAEAVYADLLRLLAQLLAATAIKQKWDPVVFARQVGEDFINSCPPGFDMLTAQTLAHTAASLVSQDCNPVSALELAQGVIPMFDLLSGDGHAQLKKLIDAAVGLVLAVAVTNPKP